MIRGDRSGMNRAYAGSGAERLGAILSRGALTAPESTTRCRPSTSLRRSSVVERAAVNRLVVGSSPTAGATLALNLASFGRSGPFLGRPTSGEGLVGCPRSRFAPVWFTGTGQRAGLTGGRELQEEPSGGPPCRPRAFCRSDNTNP